MHEGYKVLALQQVLCVNTIGFQYYKKQESSIQRSMYRCGVIGTNVIRKWYKIGRDVTGTWHACVRALMGSLKQIVPLLDPQFLRTRCLLGRK